MKVRWYVPTNYLDPSGPYQPPVWPEGWAIPRVGDGVVLIDGRSLRVKAVDWMPHGEDPGDEPFVYVVLE